MEALALTTTTSPRALVLEPIITTLVVSTALSPWFLGDRLPRTRQQRAPMQYAPRASRGILSNSSFASGFGSNTGNAFGSNNNTSGGGLFGGNTSSTFGSGGTWLALRVAVASTFWLSALLRLLPKVGLAPTCSHCARGLTREPRSSNYTDFVHLLASLELTISTQAASVRTTTTPPHRPSARNHSVAQQRAVASSAAVARQEARLLADSGPATTTPRQDLVAAPAPAPAFSEAETSLRSAAHQRQTLVVDCLAAVEAPVDLAQTTPQEASVAVLLVVSAQQQPMPPTTVPRARHSKHIPRRMVHPRHSTTRPSPSSNHIQTTLSRS